MALNFQKEEKSIESNYRPIFGKRPLFFAAVFLLFGILISAEFNVNCIYAFVISALFVVLCIFFRKWRYAGMLVLAAVLFLGMGIFSLKVNSINLENYNNTEYTVISGRVREINKKDDGSAIYKLINVMADDDKELKYSIFVSSKNDEYVLDDVIVCRGYFRKPGSKSYKFGFDDSLYCAANGVSLRFDSELDEVKEHKKDILSRINTFRMWIGRRMDEMYGKNSSIAKAMLIGLDESIDEDTLNLYRGTGISHILCISGLHLGIVCYSIYSVMVKKKKGKYIKFTVAAVILIFYIVITGFKLSILRAGIMFFIMLLGDFVGGDYDVLTSSSAAFVGIVLFNPAIVFEIGFQLSFGSVFSIICITGTLFRRKTPGVILSALSSSLAAFIGNFLIVSNMNNEISFISLIVNPIIVLLAGITVPVIAVSTLIYCVFGGITSFMGYFGIYLISLMNNIASFAGEIDLTVAMPALYGIAILASYAVVFIMSKYTMVNKVIKLFCCIAVLSVIPISYAYSDRDSDKIKIHFMNDAYSNSAIIETNNDAYLIDAGSPSALTYINDFSYDVDGVFLTAMRKKSTRCLDDFNNIAIYAPLGTQGDSNFNVKNVKYLSGGETIKIGDDLYISAFVGAESTHMNYSLIYMDRNVMTYYGASPQENAVKDADIIFIDSLTKGAIQYISESSAEYVIIKSNESAEVNGIKLINAADNGIITAIIDEDVEIVRYYDS